MTSDSARPKGNGPAAAPARDGSRGAEPPPPLESLADPAAMARHRAAVAKVSAAVAGFHARGEPYRISHGSTNSTRPQEHARAVDVSSLDRVLHVDVASRRALVEPNVAMDRLVEHTLRHGLVPPVVMEFPGITCGGGFAGTGGESSSFRHGYFDDNVDAVEMVLADGEVARASRDDENADRRDLFFAAAGAVGTLGITTALELRLVEARTYVRTTYRRVHSVAAAIRAVEEEVARPENDYVDGILFGKDHGVVVSGVMTDDKPAGAEVQTFSRARDPWYYMHVQRRTEHLTPPPPGSAAATGSTVTEYIPLAEYLFRYDRGGFWVGRMAFHYFFFVPFNRVTRWILDDTLHTRMMYRALHASLESRSYVIQDLALPFSTAERFVDYATEKTGIWPLWLCPLRRREGQTFHPVTRPPPSSPYPSSASSGDDHPIDAKQMLNIGVWGHGPKDHEAFVRLNRELETRVHELGGRKWLYAHTYYDEADFWTLYGGRAWYDALRARFHAGSLPSVYDKVRVKLGGTRSLRDRLKLTWPVGGVYGVYKALLSGDFWLHRRARWKWKGEAVEAERRRAIEAAGGDTSKKCSSA